MMKTRLRLLLLATILMGTALLSTPRPAAAYRFFSCWLVDETPPAANRRIARSGAGDGRTGEAARSGDLAGVISGRTSEDSKQAMDSERADSLSGSPTPADLFEPHMPSVDLLSDMKAFFAEARSGGSPEAQEREVAVVTPGRMIMFLPSPTPGSMPKEEEEAIHQLLPSQQPLEISVVSYTRLEALMKDGDKTRCIPFLGYLLGFAYVGHRVVVFEGHPTAFEAGVQGTDVLIIDSGMLPFLQDDWFDVASRVMKPGARILLHDRKAFELRHVVSKTGQRADQIHTIGSEPGGEKSYVNCLLTTLARSRRSEVEINSAQPLPDIADLEVEDVEDRLWIATLPFRHQRLDADRVIDEILGLSGRRWFHFFESTWRLPAKLVTSGGIPRDVLFWISLSQPQQGQRKLVISRLPPGG